ncbi:MAG: hypothetical protein K2Q18_15245, partial [Bdellovibrionales bacterium]|nr:hypothetical protein [Bdellovibrionales bacterium]
MKLTQFITHLILLTVVIAASACVSDTSASKKRGLVKDFSTGGGAGCGTKYLKYVTPYDTCTTACSAATDTEGGYHLASTTELATIKTTLTNQSNTSLLAIVTGSANLCVPDVVDTSRPTNAIEINSDFCSCVDGKSDIINNCDTTCSQKPVTTRPTLYVKTIPGLAITGNTKIKNVHNWCNVQLASDDIAPGCTLNAVDEYNNTINLAVNTVAGSNDFTADVQNLQKNRTYILKLVESKSGSNAQSKSFQINRKDQTTDPGVTGALEVSPISQYSCFLYGYSQNGTTGAISRDAFARRFYYYTADEMPSAIAPASGTTPLTTVCHDQTINPGNDNITYNRLELIPGAFSIWNKNDSRFVLDGSKPKLNTTIQTRLANEYKVTSTVDLFRTFNSMTSPNSPAAGVYLGYIMVPFKNSSTGKTYCPTAAEFNGTDPLLNI